MMLKKEKPSEAEALLHEYLKTAPVRTGLSSPAAVHEWLGRLYESRK